MTPPLVLCYHALSPGWSADLSTTPERFEAQLRLLLGRGWRAVTFTEAVTGPPSGKVFAVTFDDAFRSVQTLGLPILQRLGIPATMFVPTAFPDSGGPLRWPGVDHWLDGPDAHELEPMSWEELRALADAGWELGAHTVTHPHLTQTGDAQLAEELARSKADVERELGRPCSSIAYPYGDVDARVVAATRAAGYQAAGALPHRIEPRGALEYPRVGIYNADDERRFKLKVSPAVAWVRRSPAWRAVEKARALRAR